MAELRKWNQARKELLADPETAKEFEELRPQYSQLTDGVEKALDHADRVAEESSYRVTNEEGFADLRRRLH